MNELMKIFEYHGAKVRTVIKDGEPWFVAKDICEILELSDVSMSVSRLDEDEKLIQKIFASGQNRDIMTVNEAGLYSLVLTSNKPEAKEFKRWITHEVIPTIRRHGMYLTPDTAKMAVQDKTTFLAHALVVAQEVIQDQAKQLEEAKPAIDFMHRYVEARSNKSFREVAKILGVRERTFIDDLVNDKVVFRQGDTLLPYADYQHKGYFEVKTGESNGHAYHQTRFTPAGIAWIAQKYAEKSKERGA